MSTRTTPVKVSVDAPAALALVPAAPDA